MSVPSFTSYHGTGYLRQITEVDAKPRIDRPPRTAAVIGAGPGGLAAARRLADAGFKTILFEERPDPALESIEDLRGIVLTISRFGLAAVGPEIAAEIEARGRHLNGRAVYVEDAIILEPYGFKPGDGFIAISRKALLQLLTDAAVRAGVNIYYQHKVFNPRAATGELEVRVDQLARLHNRRYDLMVFADGVNGTSRAIMGADASYRKIVDKQYVAVTIEGAASRFFTDRISFWPGNRNVVIAIPDANDGVNALLVGDFDGHPDKPPFPSEAAAQAFLRSQNLQALRQLPEMSRLLARRPRGFFHISDTTRWTRGRAVLVGDAARCLPPYAGIGAAAAMDDARVLADCMIEEPTIEAALQRYQWNRTIASELLRQMVAKHGELLTAEIGSMQWRLFSFLKQIAEALFGARDLYQQIVFEHDGLDRLVDEMAKHTVAMPPAAAIAS